MKTIKYNINGDIKYELKHAYKGDAAYDVYLQKDINIYPGETLRVPTGITLELPEGVHAMYVPRSSTSLKGIYISNCVIDSNYRGESSIIMTNISSVIRMYKKGERIASLLLFDNRFENDIELVQTTLEEIDTNTSRGSNNHGSSGK